LKEVSLAISRDLNRNVHLIVDTERVIQFILGDEFSDSFILFLHFSVLFGTAFQEFVDVVMDVDGFCMPHSFMKKAYYVDHVFTSWVLGDEESSVV
jgi:hypothetical protein